MIHTIDIITELSSVLNSAAKEYPGGEYYFYCPLCNHYKPKLAININKMKWHCWKCGASGKSIFSLLKKLDVSIEQYKKFWSFFDDVSLITPTQEEHTGKLLLPEEFVPILNNIGKNDTFRKITQYLFKERKLTAKDLFKYNIGYCSSGRYYNRIIVPSYDDKFELNYFAARSLDSFSSYPYLLPPVNKNIIGFESLIDWTDRIVLCEGVFDAIAIRRNAIPLFGKTISNALITKLIDKEVQEVYICLDYNETKDSMYLVSKLNRLGITCKFVKLTGKDPGVLGFSKMNELIENSKVVTYESKLKMMLYPQHI